MLFGDNLMSKFSISGYSICIFLLLLQLNGSTIRIPSMFKFDTLLSKEITP